MDFHVTIDFNDDLWFAKKEWTEELLRELIRAYARRGIKAIHWIDQGTIDDGIHDRGGYIDRLGTAWDFIQRVPRPLEVVADEAHRQGIKAYSVLKCFDLGFGMPWCVRPAGDPHDPPTGISFVGGEGVLAHRWIREHPDRRAKLHPALEEKLPRRPLRAIRIWNQSRELPQCAFALFGSENNRDYRRYTGPQKFNALLRRRRPPLFATAPQESFGPEAEFACVEFSGLDLHAPFMAVVPEQPCKLANTLSALAELEDDSGNTVAFTYGLVPVMDPENRTPGWRTAGIAFDAAIQTPVPGRGWTREYSGGRYTVDIGERGFVGLARGRNRYLAGVVELAYADTRQWLCNMASQALDFGCDGVDIRLTTHTESLDWENYGFGPPIAEEFKRRHGVDLLREPFDRASWRRLRGEYVDALLQEAGTQVRRRGKTFSVQLSNLFDTRAEDICFHEIYFDWKRWLTQRWMDIGNLNSFAFREPFYAAAVKLCHDMDVQLQMTPSMHSARDEDWQRDGPDLFDACIRDRFAAFNIYESASVARLEKGGIEFLCPSLWKLVEKYQKQ